MAGLVQIGELVEKIETAKVSVEEGSTRLAEIDQTPAPFGSATTPVSFGLMSAGFAVLLSLA